MGRANYTQVGKWDNYGDDWQTPLSTVREIVDYFNPQGAILEPCKGEGNFLKFFPGEADVYWNEIKEGKDFFDWPVGIRVHWIVTNPPYSCLSKFMAQCWAVADNVVLLVLASAIWNSYKRVREWREAGMGLHTIYCLSKPDGLPQIGRPFAAVYWQRGYAGSVYIVNEEAWMS